MDRGNLKPAAIRSIKMVVEKTGSPINLGSIQEDILKICNQGGSRADMVLQISNCLNLYITTAGKFKVGFGGSHIWISDFNNERHSIIYF